MLSIQDNITFDPTRAEFRVNGQYNANIETRVDRVSRMLRNLRVSLWRETESFQSNTTWDGGDYIDYHQYGARPRRYHIRSQVGNSFLMSILYRGSNVIDNHDKTGVSHSPA